MAKVFSYSIRWRRPEEKNIPDADIYIDMRKFPNPYHNKALRALTGKDSPVVSEVMGDKRVRALVQEMVKKITEDNSLTIAVGCTGGRHRSVVVADQIAFATGLTAEHTGKWRWE